MPAKKRANKNVEDAKTDLETSYEKVKDTKKTTSRRRKKEPSISNETNKKTNKDPLSIDKNDSNEDNNSINNNDTNSNIDKNINTDKHNENKKLDKKNSTTTITKVNKDTKDIKDTNDIKESKTEISLPQRNTKTRRVINIQTIEDSLNKIENELVKERNNIIGLLKMFSDVRKDYSRLSKEISKKGKKRNDSTEKKKLTGALGPIFLDDELCSFLNKPKGTQMNAPEVIRALNIYIVNNKLQVNDNKTIINPDDKLSNLLQVDEGEQLTYFNIQKYLSKHYIKNKT